jgi:hypothetical protein
MCELIICHPFGCVRARKLTTHGHVTGKLAKESKDRKMEGFKR